MHQKGMHQKVQQAEKLIASKAKRRFKDLRRPRRHEVDHDMRVHNQEENYHWNLATGDLTLPNGLELNKLDHLENGSPSDESEGSRQLSSADSGASSGRSSA
jgi:hypothetical protein